MHENKNYKYTIRKFDGFLFFYCIHKEYKYEWTKLVDNSENLLHNSIIYFQERESKPDSRLTIQIVKDTNINIILLEPTGYESSYNFIDHIKKYYL